MTDFLRKAFVLVLLAAATPVFGQPPAGPPRGGAGGAGAGGPGQGRGGRGGMQRPQRDTAQTAPKGTGSIAGRVLAADTGRPLKRARVIVTVGGRPYTATTDDQGRYAIAALPAGTCSITAARTGFVDGAFGQRRALRSGAPVDLAEGQQLVGIDVRLSRGGVITGRLLDEDGEPLARAMVTVLRQQYVRGEKQMAPAGADQSDDRGQYRIFGLPPGDYFISATAGGVERIIRQLIDPAAATANQAPESTGYAATYYPGVITAGDATRVKLAASQEVAGIDFQLQIVPLATVKGVVLGGSGMVMLVPEEGGSLGGGRGGGRGGGLGPALLGGQGLRTATKQDGTFSIAGVTPGTYTIIARVDGGPGGTGRTAMQPLVVSGEEVNVSLTPAPGVQVSGTITLEGSGTAVPKTLSGFRVNPSPLDSSLAIPRARAAAGSENGQFSIPDMMAGRYVIRGTAPSGWTMKAVYLDGRDITNQMLEIKTENISGINVIFTDRISRLSGTVRDRRDTAVAGLTVIAFPADDKLWTSQSRQIVTARTDPSGAYKISPLPPGDYFVVAVEDVEQGEWFDPAFLEQIRDQAKTVTIGEGEQRTQDLKAPSS